LQIIWESINSYGSSIVGLGFFFLSLTFFTIWYRIGNRVALALSSLFIVMALYRGYWAYWWTFTPGDDGWITGNVVPIWVISGITCMIWITYEMFKKYKSGEYE